ncbi:MAG: hypothetical protein LW875_06205 [Proteobacteria bacterium]|jgi:hypothetical protein|nr:hypothetical protein [Pseudomonadota bacterium]
MKRVFRGLVPILFVLTPSLSFGKTLVDRVVENQTTEKNPLAAKNELTSDAMTKVSEELIKEIIGEAKYARNRNLIVTKIIRNSARYIPFSKSGELQSLSDGGWKLTTNLRVSVDDLQTMLLEQGLFYEQDSTPIVLPLIQWTDKIAGRSLNWRSGGSETSSNFLLKQATDFENVLKNAFQKNNFYLLRPQNTGLDKFLPTSYQAGFLSIDLETDLAQKFGSQLVVRGIIELETSQRSSISGTAQVSFRLTAVQALNNRTIAEIVRVFDVERGSTEVLIERKLKEVSDMVAQDLSNQVLEAWQKGTLNASLYRLSVRGRLPLQNQELFKEVLKSKVREIKSVRERWITADEVVFEIDSSISPQEIAKRLSDFAVGSFRYRVVSSSEAELAVAAER